MSDFLQDWLQSVETGGPFHRCTKCACELGATGHPWIVNKEWHRGECVMEYALCHHCRREMQASISGESMRFVQRFFEEHIDPVRFVGHLGAEGDPKPLIAGCFACGQPRESVEGFGISAIFEGPGVLEIGPLPVLMCSACSAKVEAGISKPTRESWQRFVENHFPGPPGLDEPMPRRMPAMF